VIATVDYPCPFVGSRRVRRRSPRSRSWSSPFGLGWLETRLFSPLALPGYLIFTIGTAIGNAISPRLDFWVYWVPFLGGTAGIAVVAGFGYEWWCDRRDGGSSERLCKDDCSTATDGRSIVTVRVATNQSFLHADGESPPMSFEEDDRVVLHDEHSEFDGETGTISQTMESMFGDVTSPPSASTTARRLASPKTTSRRPTTPTRRQTQTKNNYRSRVGSPLESTRRPHRTDDTAPANHTHFRIADATNPASLRRFTDVLLRYRG